MTTNGTNGSPHDLIVLDIDALIPTEKKVKFGGVLHTIEAATTETYLKVLRIRKKMGTIEPDDELAQGELAVELLCLVIPTLDRAKVLRIPVGGLMKLVDIVNREMEGEAVAQEATTAPGELTLVSSLPG